MTTLDNNYNNHTFDTVFQSDFILNKFKKVVAQNSQIHTLKKYTSLKTDTLKPYKTPKTGTL